MESSNTTVSDVGGTGAHDEKMSCDSDTPDGLNVEKRKLEDEEDGAGHEKPYKKAKFSWQIKKSAAKKEESQEYQPSSSMECAESSGNIDDTKKDATKVTETVTCAEHCDSDPNEEVSLKHQHEHNDQVKQPASDSVSEYQCDRNDQSKQPASDSALEASRGRGQRSPRGRGQPVHPGFARGRAMAMFAASANMFVSEQMRMTLEQEMQRHAEQYGEGADFSCGMIMSRDGNSGGLILRRGSPAPNEAVATTRPDAPGRNTNAVRRGSPTPDEPVASVRSDARSRNTIAKNTATQTLQKSEAPTSSIPPSKSHGQGGAEVSSPPITPARKPPTPAVVPPVPPVEHSSAQVEANKSSAVSTCKTPNPKPKVTNQNPYLGLWQSQHVAKAIVDNAINKTLEETGLSPCPGLEENVSRAQVEAAGVSQAIRSRGLRRPAEQAVEPLNPVVQRLVQVSENIFSQNLSQPQGGAPAIPEVTCMVSIGQGQGQNRSAPSLDQVSGFQIGIMFSNRPREGGENRSNTRDMQSSESVPPKNMASPSSSASPSSTTHPQGPSSRDIEKEAKKESVEDVGVRVSESTERTDLMDAALSAAICEKGLMFDK